jgi:hypothetical protein
MWLWWLWWCLPPLYVGTHMYICTYIKPNFETYRFQNELHPSHLHARRRNSILLSDQRITDDMMECLQSALKGPQLVCQLLCYFCSCVWSWMLFAGKAGLLMVPFNNCCTHTAYTHPTPQNVVFLTPHHLNFPTSYRSNSWLCPFSDMRGFVISVRLAGQVIDPITVIPTGQERKNTKCTPLVPSS